MVAHAVGSKVQVYHGTAAHTAGGLTRKNLVKVDGRIKYVKKRKTNSSLRKWAKAVSMVKKQMGLPKGTFLKPKRGTKVYAAVKAVYNRM